MDDLDIMRRIDELADPVDAAARPQDVAEGYHQ
jgi:hypothetical protein